VKKKVGFFAGFLAIGLVVYLAAQLTAQEKGGSGTKPAPASPRTRIAIFNLSHVIENYGRFKDFLEETKKDIASYDEQLKPLVEKYEKYSKELAATKQVDDSKKDAIKEEMKKVERDIKDLREKGQEAVVKKEAYQFKMIYKDVEDTVAKYAKAYGIELVMHYNDFTGEKKETPQNARNKFGYAPLFPVYSAPGIDVTNDILTSLNNAYNKKKAANSGAGH
jgi:Skp family chaperone for outer membrane proteins